MQKEFATSHDNQLLISLPESAENISRATLQKLPVNCSETCFSPYRDNLPGTRDKSVTAIAQNRLSLSGQTGNGDGFPESVTNQLQSRGFCPTANAMP
ncbi:MAG TPA: hypothetical protein VFD58_06655 [Blastocatellia bacterium]|nr:hypothetical protein [Blastocatellia bacterium]